MTHSQDSSLPALHKNTLNEAGFFNPPRYPNNGTPNVSGYMRPNAAIAKAITAMRAGVHGVGLGFNFLALQGEWRRKYTKPTIGIDSPTLAQVFEGKGGVRS